MISGINAPELLPASGFLLTVAGLYLASSRSRLRRLAGLLLSLAGIGLVLSGVHR